MSATSKTERANASEQLYYRPREVARLTGLGLRTIYAHVYAGIIPSRNIGDARLIPASWLLARKPTRRRRRFGSRLLANQVTVLQSADSGRTFVPLRVARTAFRP